MLTFLEFVVIIAKNVKAYYYIFIERYKYINYV